MALMALGIDILLPAFDDIRVAFGLAEDSSAPGQLITVYFIGLAVAQLASSVRCQIGMAENQLFTLESPFILLVLLVRLSLLIS